MTTDNQDIDEAFDLLHELAELSSDERAEHYSTRNVALLTALAADLFTEDPIQLIGNPEEFVQMTERLEEQEAYWSRSVGKAILEAADFRDKGDVANALNVLNRFVENCSSSSYREIALAEKENYIDR
jgi:hypothetical protein